MNSLILRTLYMAGIRSIYDLRVFRWFMLLIAIFCIPSTILSIYINAEEWWVFCVFGAMYSYIATVISKELRKYS